MKFIYLIQSDKPKVPYAIPEGSEVLLLQWKEEYVACENSFHYPNSSWASGRNELLRRAREKGEYDYYILLDDDLKLFFSLRAFEEMMATYNMKRIVPFLFHHPFYFPAQGESERVKYVDHAFMAFRKDCLGDVFPYTLKHDETCWWLASEDLCERFWKKWPKETIRLNYFVCINQQHRVYPKSEYQELPENIVSPHS